MPGHQHKTKVPNNIPDRFIRIHRKFKTRPGVPPKAQEQNEATRLLASPPATPTHRKHEIVFEKNNHQGNSEETAIPNPTPDTGFRPPPTPTHTSSTGSVVPTGSAAPTSPTAHLVPLNKTGLPSPAFSALPPVTSLDPSPTTESLSSPYTGPEPSLASAAEAHQTSPSRRLSIPLVVLLAIGSGLLLIGVVALLRYYGRPARRPRPKPSRPILDDPFADDKEFADESPIFGGKEIMSPRPNANGGLWSWSQYPHPGTAVSKPDEVAKPSKTSGGICPGYGVAHSPRPPSSKVSYSGRNGKAQYHISSHAHTQSVPIATSGDSPYQASLDQVQGALSRAVSRISAASMSWYPGSPQSGIGLAISRSPKTAFTADGSNVLKRTEPKATLARSRSNSVVEGARDPLSKSSSFFDDSACEGSDVGSPSFLPYRASRAAPPKAYGGRSRIKSSYYAPGSYPRPPAASNKAEDSRLQCQLPTQKSEPRRDRDTQALTDALGLSSPATDYVAPSPQPTLYPDDSLSIIEAKRPRKLTHKKKGSDKDERPSLLAIATAMEASAALGSLMLMDFNGQTTRVDDASAKPKRMSTMALGKPTEWQEEKASELLLAKTGGAPAPLKRKISRNDDKPPSIPLPAPLPSLAQMALEYENPQAYADYRSPTYSIYGLYGSDRQSGVGY
ncbi:hypothetical protein LshimejAT787_0204430 [Lyophyllum shimeji]|uniref:Uncharacterized protein n=1 Tax=Lyophyllum shimeji TaxID=47721 RepID=A0A9P3PG90_LYOSH|nr:hypothetical protein LshimejAT787_0204430 [Lyophyllum shimeji]